MALGDISSNSTFCSQAHSPRIFPSLRTTLLYPTSLLRGMKLALSSNQEDLIESGIYAHKNIYNVALKREGKE
ncbi:unnamed protein product [Dovyalis caffra]|uniref:Uncharacterized protein n=1 Tax=Dovyalis caffra TaxID=77055 RepID=A0AAV1RKR0_9ROSI|nr:unnamed protein product [Dovyalis caffra]